MPEQRRLKDNIPQYLKQLVNLAWDCQNAMFNYEQERERPSIGMNGMIESEKEFKDLLQRLYFRYEPKFKNSSVSIDSDVKKALKNNSVINLDFETAKKLCINIRDLMEDIGHTTFTQKVHKDVELGGKK
ncbi:MAG: hypothetical protein ACLFUH_10880 [Bacteroidales bacterium]